MSSLGVIGNISVDTACYPGGRRHDQLGGAALYVALAAARAGLSATPVSVVGDDLAHMHADARLAELDLARVLVVGGRSCRFGMTYGSAGNLVDLTYSYGVAEVLTGHAMAVLAGWEFDHWHVCCRRPLDVDRVLARLVTVDLPFSVDFHIASAAEQINAAAAALPYATAIFVNAAEYQILADLTDSQKLAAVIVSDGPHQVTLLRHGEPAATATPETGAVVEVTGAGDTLAGTFLAEAARKASDRNALTRAVTAASRQARSPGLRYRPANTARLTVERSGAGEEGTTA